MSTTARSNRWFRTNLWLHRWSSLVATPMFLILCITGTILIFHHEIDEALGYTPEASIQSSSRPLQDSVTAAYESNPGQRILNLSVEPEEHPGVVAMFMAPQADTGFERSHAVYAEHGSAKILAKVDPAATPTGFLFELHAQWFLGPVGELIGAFIALLVLISLVSGVVIYAPYVKRIAFGVLRRGRGTRLLQIDLHNFIGCVVLGWLFVVTLTGFLLGFGTIALGVWQATELKELKQALDTGGQVDVLSPPIGVDRALRAAEQAAPGWRANSVFFPGTDFSTSQHYTVVIYGNGLRERMFRIVIVDAATGSVAAVKDLPIYLKAIQVSQPLHFGDYGGLSLKLLWVTCSWLALFITGNGAWLWWNRRRKAARAADAVAEPVV